MFVHSGAQAEKAVDNWGCSFHDRSVKCNRAKPDCAGQLKAFACIMSSNAPWAKASHMAVSSDSGVENYTPLMGKVHGIAYLLQNNLHYESRALIVELETK